MIEYVHVVSKLVPVLKRAILTMAEKRRDSKGHILRTGESQRKDGRYAYKYTDSTGKPEPGEDGYTNFLFLNRDGLPKVRMNYDNIVRCLVKKYNKHRKEPLPNITPLPSGTPSAPRWLTLV